MPVAAVRYENRTRYRLGVASTHLADRVATGDQVRVFVRPSHGLHLPASPDALVIMIGGYGDDGLLTRLDLAFSRDQEGKVYVQHRFLEHAAELWSWLEEGPHLNICGDAQRMAQDVEAGLCYIIAKEGRIDAAAAKAYLGRLARKSLKKTSTEPE